MLNDTYPNRTNGEVEKLADDLIRAYSENAGLSLISAPVPVEDIAEHFLGYSIDITDEGLFADPNVLGGIDFEAKIIFANASIVDHDGRYAFTVAHEIGHHVLHRSHYLQSHAQDPREILCREAKNKPQIEHEADRFAAALLIPSVLIQAALKNIDASKSASSIRHARGLADKLIKQGQFYNVSNTAMLNRLRDLGILPTTIPYQDGITRGRLGKPAFMRFLIRRLLRAFGSKVRAD